MSCPWTYDRPDWRDAASVRSRLTAGADPNARLYRINSTPLHEAVISEVPGEVIEVLVGHGAQVDAADDTGATPLWEAVRWGNRDAVAALLRAGADPWRAAVAGRSPGRVALDGPLADLFAGLPDAPVISEFERARQAEADAVIASYEWEGYWDGLDIAFVAGLDEDEVIRRLGADPAASPLTVSPFLQWGEDDTSAWDADEDEPEGFVDALEFDVWVAEHGGGVVLLGQVASGDETCARLSVGTVLTSVFFNPKGCCYIYCWCDGEQVRQTEPAGCDADAMPEEWLYRFGDHAHPSSHQARGLAFMTAVTGVRIDERWLIRARKRGVRI